MLVIVHKFAFYQVDMLKPAQIESPRTNLRLPKTKSRMGLYELGFLRRICKFVNHTQTNESVAENQIDKIANASSLKLLEVSADNSTSICAYYRSLKDDGRATAPSIMFSSKLLSNHKTLAAKRRDKSAAPKQKLWEDHFEKQRKRIKAAHGPM